jgi:uncharacterized cupredoxin-like copper-binding protein
MKRFTALFGLIILISAVVAAGGHAVGSTASSPEAAAATKVTVTATEYKFKLSRKSVPKGAVTFVLLNKGKMEHDFKIGGKKTPVIKPKKVATITVVLKKGPARYLCTVPGHAAAGMKGVLTVTG